MLKNIMNPLIHNINEYNMPVIFKLKVLGQTPE